MILFKTNDIISILQGNGLYFYERISSLFDIRNLYEALYSVTFSKEPFDLIIVSSDLKHTLTHDNGETKCKTGTLQNILSN
jgi:hypothetical protein